MVVLACMAGWSSGDISSRVVWWWISTPKQQNVLCLTTMWVSTHGFANRSETQLGATSALVSGVEMMDSGIGVALGARVGIVGTGLGDVGSGLSKAIRFMGTTITWHSGGSKRGASSTPVNSFKENGGMKPLQ
ncbi:hypothetical protein Ancab_028911 [Ancistrocladus abbreviatus]